ncbi:hypothetical protein BaRGS_00015838 [Batillaria attramentaria]|uniref:DDB1- and CUL4-associated factor 15 WD40 repeat-containing domain-containing protein n=1 Tax=Batillaria attramentaria TaxID=370345 RepID=A0ABD0L0X3_9CAEN
MAASLVHKLAAREICGSFRSPRRKLPWKLFTKIPGRMCYRLKSLVPAAILEEGKSGQFVLSYSLYLDTEEHTAYPIYVYKLQWWLFLPSKPLQLISEVRLFGDEDITQDLFIAYCEWPQDADKIIIYGHSVPGAHDDTCQCFLTVTAVPSVGNCSNCLSLKKGTSTSPVFQQCLLHSYCVHTKFDLAPPFPFFSPRVQLRVDGIVVLNTGDSLVALQVDTKLPLQSFDDAGRLSANVSGSEGSRESRTDRTILGADLSILGTVTTYYTQDSVEDRTSESSGQKRRHASGSSVCEITAASDEEEENFYSPDFSENSDNDQADGKCGGDEKVQRVCDKCRSPLRGNAQCCCSLLVVSGYRPALRTKNESSANNSENVKNGNGVNGHYVASHECLSPKSPKSPKSSSGYQDNIRSPHSVCSHSSGGVTDKAGGQTSITDRDRDTQSHCFCAATAGLHSPPTAVVHSPTFEVCAGKSLPSDSEDNVPCSTSRLSSSQRSFFSSTSSSGDTGSHSQSSESVIVHTNYARTLTYSVRRFALGSEELLDSPQLAEDEYDLAYRSILPAQVVWNKKPLNIIRTVKADMSLITVLQMTFDIEHYMVEAIHNEAEWGQRYIAFCNYDLQILDVCPDSGSVYGTVYTLIQAKESADPRNKHRALIKLYQTSFTFELNLSTGLYSTLHIGELTEADEQLLRGREWKPGSRECCLLRRKVAVPQSFFRSVHVLSNEAVFKGQSMSLLVAPYQYTAIML